MTVKRPGLSAFQLKLIALVSMTIDHIAQFLEPVAPIPFWFHIIGRIAAPVFIYLTAWGAHYTSSRWRYLLRLYISSVIMALTALCANRFADLHGLASIPNNILATLFLIVLYITLLERAWQSLKARRYWRALGCALLLPAPVVLFIATEYVPLLFTGVASYWAHGLARALLPDALSCEGSIFIIFLGVGLYFFRNSRAGTVVFYILYCAFKLLMSLPGGLRAALTVNVQWMMLLALPLLLIYNRRLGSRTAFGKYLFYVYYPAHIFALYLLYAVIATA